MLTLTHKNHISSVYNSLSNLNKKLLTNVLRNSSLTNNRRVLWKNAIKAKRAATGTWTREKGMADYREQMAASRKAARNAARNAMRAEIAKKTEQFNKNMATYGLSEMMRLKLPPFNKN